MKVEGLVGPQAASDGSQVQSRLGRSGEVIVTELHGKYYEQSVRNRVFHASLGASGAVLGETGGSTVGLALYNPAGAVGAVNVSIIRVVVIPISGTYVLGGLAHAVNVNLNNAAAPTGTAIVEIPALVGSAARSAAKALLTATLPAIPTILRLLGAKNVSGASNPLFGQGVYDDVDGQIILAPGTCWCIYGLAADTSPVVSASVTWEEVPV